MAQLEHLIAESPNGNGMAQAPQAPHEHDRNQQDRNQQDQAEVRRLMSRMRREPLETLTELVCSRREAREHCELATETVAKQHALLEELFEPPHLVGYLERLRFDRGGRPKAVVLLNGQRRVLAIHPDVDLAELERLMPWHQVLVNPKELVVVGMRTDTDLRDRCQGEVVEYKGYHERERGMALVGRNGNGEEIVTLAPPLREATLATGERLVLHRDIAGWAIDRLPSDRVETRYEVPIESITTRLEDLAGLDSVVVPLVEDLLLRVVYPEHRAEFDLKPLNGFILYSHKAGMGKTARIRALVRRLHDLGREKGFDVILNSVKPNEFKSSFHGEDAANVRRFAATLRARLAQPRKRPLLVFNVFDECDSLGSRNYRSEQWVSAAQNDCVQALLAEMDGLVQLRSGEGPPVEMVWVGLTNAPDGVDHALKRPGRFGDLGLAMPDYTIDAAEAIVWVHARNGRLPWFLDDTVRRDLAEEEIRQRIIRPALACVFPATVLRYTTEGQRKIDVTAGEILAGVHYESALDHAKRKAAERRLLATGVPAIGSDDLVEALIDVSHSAAAQLVADPQALVRTLQIKVPVVHPELVNDEEFRQHHDLRPYAG